MYNTKEGKSCVIYIRVSSERQVKGYSLDGQKHYLAECAERRGMTVLDTYVEEGKSGKSIEGRMEFQRMLDDIQSGKVIRTMCWFSNYRGLAEMRGTC